MQQYRDDSSHEEYPMLRSDESLNNYKTPFSSRRKRRYVYLGCIGLVIASTLAYFATSIPRTITPKLVQSPTVIDNPSRPSSSSEVDLLDPSLYLNGPPTQAFRGTWL